MELYYYFFIYLITLLSVFIIKDVTKSVLFFIPWWLIALTLSVVIRIYIDYDVKGGVPEGYIDTFSRTEGIVWRGMFPREFIFWGLGVFFYNITGNEMVVFFLFDLLVYVLMFASILNIRKTLFLDANETSTLFLLLGLLLFFPFIIGMHDTYRQLISSIVLLYSITKVLDKKFIKAILYFIVSIFLHNSSIIFLPLLLFMSDIKKYKFYSVTLIVFMPIAIYFVLKYDILSEQFAVSLGEVGKTIAYWYLLIFIIIVLGVRLISIYSDSFHSKTIIQYSTLLCCIYMACVFLIPSESSQRVAYSICVLLYPMIGYYFIENFSANKVISRLIYLHFSLLPLIHYNSIVI